MSVCQLAFSRLRLSVLFFSRLSTITETHTHTKQEEIQGTKSTGNVILTIVSVHNQVLALDQGL